MKKLGSVLLCLIMLFIYIPVGLAGENSFLPQTPSAYSTSETNSLAAAGYDLSPTFETTNTDYAVNVSDAVYRVDINRTMNVGLSSIPEPYVARFVGGDNHAAAILEDGTVTLWGDNSSRQLEVPLEANGIKALAAGARHTLALKEDGSVVGWGQNQSGQCNVPAVLEGAKVKSITAFGSTSVALSEDNKIFVWGRFVDDDKELESSKNLIDIAMNNDYLLALAEDGTVEAWKWHDSFNTCEVPTGFSGNVVSITTGQTHALALKADGSVVSWGNDDYPVPTGLNARAIAAGEDYSAVLTTDGDVRIWGKDQFGLLDVPSELEQVQALAAGRNNIYVLQNDGTLKSWGRNWSGEGDIPGELNLLNLTSINDRLGSLSVQSVVYDGGEACVNVCGIYPRFSCEQTEGIVDVGNNVQEVRIIAQPYSSRASLKINGDSVAAGDAVVINGSALSVGDNPIVVKVTAESGSERSYTLHVKRVSEDYLLPGLPQTPEAYQKSVYANDSRRLAAGGTAVKKDGTVISWVGAQVPSGLNNVIAVTKEMALKEDGTVVALAKGLGTALEDWNNVAGISSGQGFVAALKKDGTVMASGNNNYGQCDVPPGLSGVVDIQCGSTHMVALKADGNVAAWGNNNFGQCNVPEGLNQVVAVAAGFQHSAALKDDGTMVIWGGEPTEIKGDNRIKNLNLQYVKAIAVGNDYVAALKWDGSLAVWSHGSDMCLGVPLELDQPVLAISGEKHLLALNEDGTLKAWGDNTYGHCNIPSWLNLFEDEPPAYSGPSPNIPQTPAAYADSSYVQAAAKICYNTFVPILNMDGTVKVISLFSNDPHNLAQVPTELCNVRAIACSQRNIMALKSDGTVVVWGCDDEGQCSSAKSVTDAIAIAATDDSNTCCLALKKDGTVVAWGYDDKGQCDVPTDLNNATAIAVGEKHCLALKEDGTVAAWGNNDQGQCDVPEGLSDVARIYAEKDFSLALKDNGTVAAWGNNDQDQCDVPEGLTGVVDIAIENGTCAALRNNGTVVVWGNNQFGRCNVPPGLHDVAAVSFWGGVSAIKTDGTIVTWGNNPIFDVENLNSLSNVLTIGSKGIVIFRDGTLQYVEKDSLSDKINAGLVGINVLSGHYFAINSVDLFNSEDQSISSVASQAGYRIKARIANNYASPTGGLTIIQVRGGDSASRTEGGQVLGCVGLFGEIPVEGSVVSSDFTMPAGLSGPAYVDVFLWDGWDTMVPRAGADQNLSFMIAN